MEDEFSMKSLSTDLEESVSDFYVNIKRFLKRMYAKKPNKSRLESDIFYFKEDLLDMRNIFNALSDAIDNEIGEGEL